MKKNLLCILFLLMVLGLGCKSPVDSNGSGQNPTFTLTNSHGEYSNIFSQGEHFNMSFVFENTTSFDLPYVKGSSAPPVKFEILKDGNVIASSEDGFAYAMIVIGGSVAPGESLKGQWTAPNTINQDPQVVLAPGSYQAKVLYPTFGKGTASSSLVIDFKVIP